MRSFRGTLLALLLTTVAVSGLALAKGLTTWQEALGFVSGALCVWLTAKENIWNWPIGLINAAAYTYLFFRDKLYADATLNAIYFVLGILGWYWWLYGGKDRKELRIQRTPRRQWPALIFVGLLATFILTRYLALHLDAAPSIDAFTSIFSLVAQYQLTRKYTENWLMWIIVDLVYVPLYLWKGLYLTAILYAIFTVMAVGGLREWARLRAEQNDEVERAPLWRPVLVCLALGAVATVWMARMCWKLERFYSPATLATLRASEQATLVSARREGSMIGQRVREIKDEPFTLLKAELLDPLNLPKPQDLSACCGKAVVRIPAYELHFTAEKMPDAVFKLDPFGYATGGGIQGSVDVHGWLSKLPKDALFEP